MNQLSKKIVLVGHFGVGKTSLIQNFVHSRFSEEYLTTIGVNIEKKVMDFDETQLTTIIWDIAGEVTIDNTPPAYLLGSHGIIYVFDLLRDSTWANLDQQMGRIKQILPFAPVQIVANKVDLLRSNEVASLKSTLNVPFDCVASAKTGENVESFFRELGGKLL